LALGLTDIRFTGVGANVPNSTHTMAGISSVPLNETITPPSEAPDFVARQLAAGTTIIKMAAEDAGTPSLSQETMTTIVVAVHTKDVLVACHAADYSVVDHALTAHIDQSHHVPKDFPLNSTLISRFLAQKTVSVPTLSIFQLCRAFSSRGLAFSHCARGSTQFGFQSWRSRSWHAC
jgi:hypothetical protein